MTTDNIFSLRTAVHKGIDLARGAVEYGDLKTVTLHVQNKVFTHYGETDKADICLLHSLFPLNTGARNALFDDCKFCLFTYLPYRQSVLKPILDP